MAAGWQGKLFLYFMTATLIGATSGVSVEQCQDRLADDVRAWGRMTCGALESFSRCFIRAFEQEHIPGLQQQLESILKGYLSQSGLECDDDLVGGDSSDEDFEDRFNHYDDKSKAYFRCQQKFLSSLFDLYGRSGDEACDKVRQFMLCSLDAADFEPHEMSSWEKMEFQQRLDRLTIELGFDCHISLDSIIEEFQRREDDKEAGRHITTYLGAITGGTIAVLLIVGFSVRACRGAAIRRQAANSRHPRPVTVNHLGQMVYNTSQLPPGVTYNSKLPPGAPPSYMSEPPAYADLMDEEAARNVASAPTVPFPNSASAPPALPDSAPPAYDASLTNQYVLSGGNTETGGARA